VTPPTSKPLYSVIIANWEGEAWIERALSSVQLATRAAGLPSEIIVVDDASEDPSPSTVARRFPRVRLLRNRRNIGFARTVNRGVGAARGDLVVLLNNDLVVREDFFRKLLEPFTQSRAPLLHAAGAADPSRVFAVSARTLSWDGAESNHLCMAGQFVEGRIRPAYASPGKTAECLFAQGGAMACRRELFLALGGFDTLFAPGYWEDYDLCWQAVRGGYTILYEPAAVAFHVGGGSMTRRYGPREVYLLRLRNHLLFEWLNITDRYLLLRHVAWLPRHVFREWLRGEGFGQSRALARAVRCLPGVLRARARRRKRGARVAIAQPAPDQRLLSMGNSFILSDEL